MIILQDSREQKPWKFEQETRVVTLPTGDYSALGLEDDFVIERKGLGDMVRSATIDRERFRKELRRMSEFRWRMVVIDASIYQLRTHRYYSGQQPNTVLRNIANDSLFFQVPFIWSGGRKHSAPLVLMYFQEAFAVKMLTSMG